MRIANIIVLRASLVAVAVVAFGVTTASGEGTVPILTPDDARSHGLESLKTVVQKEGVPLPNNLKPFIKDMNAARQLGKALFHEMAAGSDGIQACVTCHFSAGADPRSNNQVSPDLLRVKNQRVGDVKGFFNAMEDPDTRYEVNGNGPNYQLWRGNFPFVRNIGNGANVIDAGGRVSPASGNSNDGASSQGISFTLFDKVVEGSDVDLKLPWKLDPVFNVGGKNTRRVEPRNTPTTINAVFNFTNFWDGRANNRFNGENPFGKQDKVARIFKAAGKKNIIATPLNLKDSSLASQAVGPPLSHFEMSFGDGTPNNFRIFPQVGRKLIKRKALATQVVDANDSLLAPLSTGMGLNTTYEALIKKAFDDKYWDSDQFIDISAPSMKPGKGKGNQFGISNGKVAVVNSKSDTAFSLMESNFAFFWGVSVMLYEATLISDESPFDNWMRGVQDPGFSGAALAGLNVFVDKGKCINCHGGPELTNASVRKAQRGKNVIEPMLMGNRQPALYDNGFYNISVTPTVDDLGRGGADPFGPAPLAFSRQFAFDALDIQKIKFSIEGAPIPDLVCHPDDTPTCDAGVLGFEDQDFGLGFFPVCKDLNRDGKCGVDDTLLLKRVAVDGAFKTPGLRNVAETGPYFHNGGFATLREVVQFYNRGGNFCRFNGVDLDPDIRGLGLSDQEEKDLVAFLISLTDPRVLSRAAPFDGPGYSVPNGHTGNHTAVTYSDGQATDALLAIPAVGKFGGAPLTAFLNGVDHFVANPVAGEVCSPNFPPVP